MLSLPEDWDYTLAGLSHINREKIDAIREAVKELEKAGYIVRSRERDEKGRLRGADYVIYEQPQPKEPEAAPQSAPPRLRGRLSYRRNVFRGRVVFGLSRSVRGGQDAYGRTRGLAFSMEQGKSSCPPVCLQPAA